MPRIIFKCGYIKNNSEHVKNLLIYVGTREGVEKLPLNRRNQPATQKQIEHIEDILSRYTDSKCLFEYDDYRNNPTLENASEFITAAIDHNLDQISHQEVYVNYIATRPRAEKLGTHGLFSDEDTPLVLSQAAKEAAQHIGNIWTPIISLQREDAARLGYDNAAAWMALIRKHRNIFAEQMKIAPENLRWYAAFHNEGHHPHCHMIIYSINPREGYVSKTAIEKMRSSLARDIFQQDLMQIYTEQTAHRNSLIEQSHDALLDILIQMQSGVCENPVIEGLLSQLSERLRHTTGKKQYGYLKAPLRELVNQIVDEMAKDERVAAAYSKWYELRNEVLLTYKDKLPEPLLLSQQKEFRQIKNKVIAEAVSLGSHQFTFEGDEEIEVLITEAGKTDSVVHEEEQISVIDDILEGDADASLSFTEASLHYGTAEKNDVKWLTASAKQGNQHAQYRLGKLYLQEEDVPKEMEEAVKWLIASAEQGSQYAQYTLGKLYLLGYDVPCDREAARHWLTLSAEQGNIYAQFFLDHWDELRDPSLFLAATRLLHHMSRIFQEEQQKMPVRPGIQVESKLRRRIRQKKISQGHATDDHNHSIITY